MRVVYHFLFKCKGQTARTKEGQLSYLHCLPSARLMKQTDKDTAFALAFFIPKQGT
jgi:hypothetical protein